MEIITSPCKLICKYDKNRFCIGCYRSSYEIINWQTMNNIEKKTVIDNIDKRKNESNFRFKMTDDD
jgi:predicted Fe-S protein YdhL (DUF1289 family)